MTIEQLLANVNVIPVIVIEQLKHAVPLAKALSAGGITTLEITLRTPVALDAIADIHNACPELVLGAGTVIDTEQFAKIKDAGATFAVSPATTLNLINAATAAEMPFLPGVCTPSEIAAARELGCRSLKFFPANLYGGDNMLNTLASLFSDIQFCPTGGISADNYQSYLNLPNVVCVGGSWLAPPALVNGEQWATITALASAIHS